MTQSEIHFNVALVKSVNWVPVELGKPMQKYILKKNPNKPKAPTNKNKLTNKKHKTPPNAMKNTFLFLLAVLQSKDIGCFQF